MIIPSKIVKDFGATVENKVILTGGMMEGKMLSKAQANELASLPSKQQLLAMLVGTMKAPLTGFYMILRALKNKSPAAEAAVEVAAAAPAEVAAEVVVDAPAAETPADEVVEAPSA